VTPYDLYAHTLADVEHHSFRIYIAGLRRTSTPMLQPKRYSAISTPPFRQFTMKRASRSTAYRRSTHIKAEYQWYAYSNPVLGTRTAVGSQIWQQMNFYTSNEKDEMIKIPKRLLNELTSILAAA
jgi:hypothetical protein